MRVTHYLRQLAGESVVYGLSGAIGQVIGLVLVPLYTRVFSPDELGVMSLVDVAVNLVSVVAILGLESASARWFYDSADPVARREGVSSWFWGQSAASVAAAGVLWALARPVAALVVGVPEAAPLVRLAAVTMPLLNIGRVVGSWYRYQRRAWAAISVSIGYSLARVTLVLVLVLALRWRLEGVYTARLVAAAAFAVVAVVALGQWIRPADFSVRRLRGMLRFGLPLVPAAVGMWVMGSADRLFLTIFWGRSEVGLYEPAAKLAGGAALIVLAFQQAWSPFAYSILKEGAARRVYARALDVFGFAGAVLATAISLFAPLLVRVVTAPEYYAAASCVPPLVFVQIFVGGRYIAALGSGIAKRSAPMAWSVGVGVAAQAVLSLALVPRWGKEGAAVATMLAYATSTVFLFAASQRQHALPYRWRVAVGANLQGWVLVGLAAWLVPPLGPVGLGIRAAMLLAFVPLAAAFGLLRRTYLQDFLRP